MISVSEINKNFKIKVNGHNYNGRYLTKLVGVSGLEKLVGQELAFKLIDRAFREGTDVVVCKLRRGLTIRFYSI